MPRQNFEFDDQDEEYEDEADDEEEDEDEDEDDEDDEDEDEEEEDEADEDEEEEEEDEAAGNFEPGLVFVGLALRGETRFVSRIIKDVCKKEGLDAQQVDERLGSGEIIKEIWELIEKAEFLIFDLTFERPNVYYEIGYAHGKGNHDNLLLIAKSGTVVHFDIGSRRVHHYSDERSLRKIVRDNLREMRGM